MGDRSPNPYLNLATIHSPDMFFGRAHLLRRFYAAIANRQSISLIGPRHIGKSTFLWCACLAETQRQFTFDLSQHIFVPLDLRKYLNKTCDDFFHLVSEQIIRQSRKSHGLSLQAWGQGEEEFSSILDEVEEHGFFPVLLLDAFDNITLNKHFGPEFFAFLRAHATKVAYVTASIAPLYEVCHRGIADSPFFNIFHTYMLEALTYEEARDLISIPMRDNEFPFSEMEIEWILRMAGRHPFFIQRVCHILLEEKIQQKRSEVDMQHVKKLAYRDLRPHFQDSWERLSDAQRTTLQDEAQQKEHPLRALPELSESALFRQFVRNTSDTMLFHMTTEELEHALEKIDDLEELGKTNVRLMKGVAERLRNETSSTNVERGIAVREILNEAFKRLQGPGSRTDNAVEWWFYNILYYRYFKHHLKNEQIAARLQFTSVRTYFRERNKAINALLNILLEMEKALSLDD